MLSPQTGTSRPRFHFATRICVAETRQPPGLTCDAFSDDGPVPYGQRSETELELAADASVISRRENTQRVHVDVRADKVNRTVGNQHIRSARMGRIQWDIIPDVPGDTVRYFGSHAARVRRVANCREVIGTAIRGARRTGKR